MSQNVKRLYRSRSNRMLGGVCAGIGDFFDIDPTLVRLFFVFAFLLGGHGFLVYLALWLVVPEQPAGQAAGMQSPSSEQMSPDSET
jgi:phage shock protein PspC (stress-responsive transcriptional regulator)